MPTQSEYTKPCPACGKSMPRQRGVCPECGHMSPWFKIRLGVGCVSIAIGFSGMLLMLYLALSASP